MNYNTSYQFTDSTKIIINNNRIILANRNTGAWIKISKNCFDILNELVINNFKVTDFLPFLHDDEDRSYITEILEKLISIQILIEQDTILNKTKCLSINFNITHRCNLNCRHCTKDASKASDIDILNTNEIKKCLDNIKLLNPNIIIISGGEPLLRNDFIEILEYAVNVKGLNVQIMTNGTLINTSNVHSLCSLLTGIDVSLDGIDELSCSIIRGENVFNKVIDSVKLLKSNGFNNISLSIVELKENEKYLYEFSKLCENLGVKPVPRLFDPSGRGLKNRESLLVDIDNYYKNILKFDNDSFYNEHPEILESRRISDSIRICTCNAGVNEITINENGDIYPCNLLTNNKFIIGNILDNDIIDLLLSDKFYNTHAFKNICQIQPDIIKPCKDCKVNLFCHTCLVTSDRCSSSDIELIKYCEHRKKFLYKLIWDEVI